MMELGTRGRGSGATSAVEQLGIGWTLRPEGRPMGWGDVDGVIGTLDG